MSLQTLPVHELNDFGLFTQNIFYFLSNFYNIFFLEKGGIQEKTHIYKWLLGMCHGSVSLMIASCVLLLCHSFCPWLPLRLFPPSVY